LRHPVGAGCRRSGEDHATTRTAGRLADPLVVRRDRHDVHTARLERTLDDMADDRLPGQLRQGFPREASGSVPGRNDDSDAPQPGATKYDGRSGESTALTVREPTRRPRDAPEPRHS